MDENTHQEDSLAQARRVVRLIDVVYGDGAYHETRAAAAAVAPWSPGEGRAPLADARPLFAIFTDPARLEASTRQSLARSRRAA